MAGLPRAARQRRQRTWRGDCGHAGDVAIGHPGGGFTPGSRGRLKAAGDSTASATVCLHGTFATRLLATVRGPSLAVDAGTDDSTADVQAR